MSVFLVPVSAQDYAIFLEQAADTYVVGATHSGEMTIEQARARADADLEALLTAGPQTPGMLLRTISVDGEPVGHIWLGVRGPAEAKYGWVWSVYVHPQHRSQGHAERAIRLVEAEALDRLGITEVRLNVFAANCRDRTRCSRSEAADRWAASEGGVAAGSVVVLEPGV